VVARGKSEQAGQADVKRVVIFNKFFAAQGMHNGSLKFAGNLDQLCVGSCATRAAEDGDLFRAVQKFGKDIEFFIRWAKGGFRFVETYARPSMTASFRATSPGNTITETPRFEIAVLNGGFQDARHLFGI